MAFLNSDISHGSAATFVRCGGIFNVDFIANVLTSLSVKGLWKSVSIWESYWQTCAGYPFFGPPCRYGERLAWVLPTETW